MKLVFIAMLLFDAAPGENGGAKGGFTPEEKKELGDALGEVKTALESKQRALVEEMLSKHAEPINAAIKKFGDWQTQKDETDQKNQEALDLVLTRVKEIQNTGNKKRAVKSIHEAIYEALLDAENLKGIESVESGRRFKMMLKGPIDMSAPVLDIYNPEMRHKMEGGQFQTKTVGDMTTGGNLTGDGLITYAPNPVILPSQKINARDLVPTVRSETGIYVNFRETGGEGGIDIQTEGSAKSQIDYDFTNVQTVNKYVAGYARFAKQFMRNLPFLQNTLPRLLQRDFFKKENRRFYDIMATAYASGGASNASTETDDVKQVMDWLTALFDTDYMASFGLLRYTALNRLNKLLYTNGYYQGSGGVQSMPDGSIRISGVPIVPVTWIPSFDKFLTFDRDYVERIEVESLAIEFFQEDANNATENKITARIECFEEFNAMLPASINLGDFGNSASS